MPPAAQGVLEIKRVGFYLWVILHTGCAHAQPAVAFCCPRCEVKQGVAILLVAHWPVVAKSRFSSFCWYSTRWPQHLFLGFFLSTMVKQDCDGKGFPFLGSCCDHCCLRSFYIFRLTWTRLQVTAILSFRLTLSLRLSSTDPQLIDSQFDWPSVWLTLGLIDSQFDWIWLSSIDLSSISSQFNWTRLQITALLCDSALPS